MTLTISEAFRLPRPEDIRAMGFVVKLREADPASDEVRQLVDDYVITPAIEKELPRILDDMKQVFDRGEEYGRFIHGSFGSGKSHFMTMLALLLEGAAPAWKKFRPLLEAHREAQQARGREAAEHEAWLQSAGLLVVRLHMLSVRGKTTGLDRVVYEAFNQALKRRGKESFQFLNVASVFDEVRREAGEYGDIVWKRLEVASIVGGREDFEAVAAGSEKARERFARAWLEYKGRDPFDAGIDPRWSEGLRRMAEHARSQGFRGIVLLVDEFLLWLAEKSGAEFVREINSLNVIVDHNTGQRPAPIFVFVARQRNLQEFFPDLVDETKIHEHLDHHAKRFEETRLQDVELRHIVKGRVLRPRHPEAVAEAVGSLSERHQKILPALLSGADIEYLADVYPFHPALIEMLVDVTSLMQRERSALRLLYELLVLHYPDLPLGEFLPVGSAFEAIFPEAGVEASKKVETMQDIHHQYYSRLRPAMRKMLEDRVGDFNEERRKALDQIVKTVLLAEVSSRLRRGGLTIEQLVQLNSVDVEGETFRGQVRVAETDLRSLSQKVPDLQLAGQGKTAIIRYNLGRVNLGEFLARARSKVDHPSQRFKVFYAALKKALGIHEMKGFTEGGTRGDWDLTWRRTRRVGRLELGNVRETAYEEFESPTGTFKVIIDYPWDDPGHSVDEDRHRAANARKKHGTAYTACWLPRHLTTDEQGVITELAAVRYLLALSKDSQDDLLEMLGPQDRTRVLEQAGTREKSLAGQLDELLREVYVQHGEFYALVNDIDSSRPRETLAENLVHIATLLMDRRYPQHPHFHADPKKQDLELLLAWMVQAGEANISVLYDEATGRALRTLGQPLELVNLGQTKASLRLDSRYMKDVLARTDQDSVAWNPIAEHLRDAYGFQAPVIDLFLCFLCQRDHRALHDSDGQPMDVRLGMPVGTPIRLQRGRLVSAADWQRLRELGQQLFDLPQPPSHRSLQIQDRFVSDLIRAGREHRTTIQNLHHRLVNLGLQQGARLAELSEANSRLAPLDTKSTDSWQVLTDLVAQWPEPSPGPLGEVVKKASAVHGAVNLLQDATRTTLEGGLHHAGVREHLVDLDTCLSASHCDRQVDAAWITAWNQKAERLLGEIVAAAQEEARRKVELERQRREEEALKRAEEEHRRLEEGARRDAEDEARKQGVVPLSCVEPKVLRETFDPSDGDAVDRLVAQVRHTLQGNQGRRLQVVVTICEVAE